MIGWQPPWKIAWQSKKIGGLVGICSQVTPRNLFISELDRGKDLLVGHVAFLGSWSCACISLPDGLEDIATQNLEEKGYVFLTPTDKSTDESNLAKKAEPSPSSIEHIIAAYGFRQDRKHGQTTEDSTDPSQEVEISVDLGQPRLPPEEVTEINNHFHEIASEFFKSYYGQRIREGDSVSVTQGLIFTIVDAGWFKGEVLEEKRYWERIKLRVVCRIEGPNLVQEFSKLIIGATVDGWYNSSKPTKTGEVSMEYPNLGTRDLEPYLRQVLSEFVWFLTSMKWKAAGG
jgi:hypothetical protein